MRGEELAIVHSSPNSSLENSLRTISFVPHTAEGWELASTPNELGALPPGLAPLT